MDDLTILTLCGFEEANLEPDDGLAAVVRVVLNRARLAYQSDGTIAGTVYWPDAFSWTAWDMVDGAYVKVAHAPAAVAARATELLARDKRYVEHWRRALRITSAVRAGAYAGPDYDRLTDRVVLYLNPAISRAVWARPDKLVCVIGRHHFFHA